MILKPTLLISIGKKPRFCVGQIGERRLPVVQNRLAGR